MSLLFRAPVVVLVLFTALVARGEANLTGPRRRKFMLDWIRPVLAYPSCPLRRRP